MGQYRFRKKVRDMSAVVRKEESREQRLAEARELADIINKETVRAGISYQELERQAYKSLKNVRARRRTGCI
jgi:hypothetical protein